MVVGDGDAYHDMEDIKEKHNLDRRLILTGKQPYSRIPEFIAAADVCILPAYSDEIIMQDIVPIKLYEYMAMGKPVITTKLPGVMKEFGKHNGVIYIDKIDGIFKIFTGMDIENNGKFARKFAEKQDWNKITNKFENKLIELLY